MKIYRKDFGKGIVCTIHVIDKPPFQPEDSEQMIPHVTKAEWSSLPSKKLVRPYIAWINGINKALADEWNTKLGHAFIVSDGQFEMWIYEPGEPPRRLPNTASQFPTDLHGNGLN